MGSRISKDQFQQIWDNLESAGIEGGYAKPQKKLPPNPGMMGNVNCRGCWEMMPDTHLLRKYRYCKKCMATRNNIDDYQKIFFEVTGWMENFVKLNDYYPIRMSWNQTSFGKDPAQVKGVFFKKYILTRLRVRRDAIPKYLVYSYMELWMSEESQNGKPHAKLCEEFLKDKGLVGDHRVISYWYMMQYMYEKGESDEAERGKKLIDKAVAGSLNDLTDKGYTLWEPGDENDDRAGLEKMLDEHPVKDILSSNNLLW